MKDLTNCIETFTGHFFDPFNPMPDDVDIRDIAHALAHQCRFTGHVRKHYSVAQHSVLVASALHEEPLLLRMKALMHDSSEAYVCDLATPLKAHPAFAFYKDVERGVMGAISNAFGLNDGTEWWHDPLIKGIDGRMCITEARDLMPFRAAIWTPWIERLGQPLDITIEPWSARDAEDAFLRRYFWLRSKLDEEIDHAGTEGGSEGQGAEAGTAVRNRGG